MLVTLKDRFDYSGAYPVFHGHITRLSALHSDLFSLGCILYFLISGGKNPEKFYVKCLEASRFERQNSGHAQTQKRKEDDLYENCLRISATLCTERGKNIIREIGCIHLDKIKCDNRSVYSNEEIEFVKQVVRERNILSIPGIGKLHGLRNYRQHLQSTSSVAYYVSDTNERPLPFAILYEIVRLLVRDKEDSYVTRIKPGNQARAPSYFDLVLHEKTQEIEDRISKVLDMSMCCKKEIRDHAIFGDTRAEYFVMLRCCLGPELLNGNGVPPAGGRNRSGAAKNQGSVCINGGRTKVGDYNRQARAKSVLRNRISPVTQAWRTMGTVMKRWAHIGWHQYMFSSKITDSIYRLILSAAAVAVAGVVSVILYSKWTENEYKPFKECEVCPEMVALPGGTFTMGSPRDEGYRQATEEPQRQVTIKPFAIGKHEVTFAEWDACVTAGGCNGYKPPDEAWGRGSRPVVNASWQNAQDYVSWLAKQTDKTYRLPTEAEWEYAARAGTMTPFSFGETISTAQANYNYNGSGQKGENRKQTVPVGSLPANPWGLHEVHGNVWEWVEDCWHGSYQDAPQDGRAWVEDLCTNRVARGGSWDSNQKDIRSAARAWMPDKRHSTMGFRVARALTP